MTADVDITIEECEEAVENPGKFEGCSRYIPYYHAIMQDGGADDEEWDENDNVTYVFEVSNEDVDMFEELNEVEYVRFYEDDNGFVIEV